MASHLTLRLLVKWVRKISQLNALLGWDYHYSSLEYGVALFKLAVRALYETGRTLITISCIKKPAALHKQVAGFSELN